MYTVVYLFPVLQAKVSALLRVQREAGEIYADMLRVLDMPRVVRGAFAVSG